MIVSSVIYVCITDASLLVIPTMTVVPANRAATIPVQILAQKIRVDRTLCAQFQIIEQRVRVSLEWYLAQLQQLVAFVHQHYHVLKIVDVHPVTAASMKCVDQCVPVIQIVLVMNDVNEDPASRYVVVMMTAEMVKFVKALFARLDAVQMTIVRIIYLALISNVSIHVSAVPHVERTLNAVVLIIKSSVLVLHHSLVMQTLVVNSRPLFVANTMTVHLITLVMEMCVNLHAVAIKIVCLMNDAFVEFVEPFAIAMLPVDKDKSVKIVCVKLDVEVTMFAQANKRVSITNVPIHVHQLVSVEHVQIALLSIMVFNAVVQLVFLETL